VAVGIGREEARELAPAIELRLGHSVVLAVGSPTLQLTVDGHRESAKLRWPRWRRRLDKNPAVVSAGISAAVISRLAKLLLP